TMIFFALQFQAYRYMGPRYLSAPYRHNWLGSPAPAPKESRLHDQNHRRRRRTLLVLTHIKSPSRRPLPKPRGQSYRFLATARLCPPSFETFLAHCHIPFRVLQSSILLEML